jgi:hypothetical protein
MMTMHCNGIKKLPLHPASEKTGQYITIAIYAISGFGVGIKQFYCCGKLKSTSISYVQERGTYEKCGMGKCKPGCCKNKYHFFKLSENHIAADYLLAPGKQVSELHDFYPAYQVTETAFEQVTVTNNSHAPPPRYGIPAYIFNCVYRI